MSFSFARSTVILVVVLFFCVFDFVQAGFGITPPYFRNTSLTRNSVYEQEILMVRGDPDEALQAEVTVDAPEIQDWIEIIEGEPIFLPAGAKKVPMTLKVTVPDDAEFKQYTGAVRIKTRPADGDIRRGAVSISLGAQIDVDFTVIDKEIEDFRVRKVSLADLNEGHKFWWLYYPGKIRFSMVVENIGNVDVAPSKVAFRIYDFSGKVLLEETENIGRLKKIEPYAVETIVAELPTRLPSGNYKVRYSIYNGDEVEQEGQLNLSILPYGTLQEAGFGFAGLSLPHKISVLLPIFVVLIVLLYVLYIVLERRKIRRRDV